MNFCWVECCSGGANDCHDLSMSMMSGGATECLCFCGWVKISGVASDCHSSGGSKLSDGAARAVVALVVQHTLDFPFGIMWSFVRFM